MGRLAPGQVHVVILNFENAPLTIECVQRLALSDLNDHQLHIYVVDNGSTDGSVEMLSRSLTDVRLIASPRNTGFAGGNNLALREIMERTASVPDASNVFALLLNNDVLVERDTIQRCLDVLDAEPDVGVVGPRLVLQNGELDLASRRSFPTISASFWKMTGLARRFPHHPALSRYNLLYLDEYQRADIDSGTAAFMLVRLSAMRQAGLLDDEFFMYGEDLDWAYRIKGRGWRVVYEPAARALHLKSTTARRHSNRMIYEFYRAMWLFYRKHYARRHPFLLNWLIRAAITGRGAVAMGLNQLRPAERKRVA